MADIINSHVAIISTMLHLDMRKIVTILVVVILLGYGIFFLAAIL
ncbi:MAG: hypothetical protein ACYCT2_06895 [Thermoplasmataceae archaeon]